MLTRKHFNITRKAVDQARRSGFFYDECTSVERGLHKALKEVLIPVRSDGVIRYKDWLLTINSNALISVKFIACVECMDTKVIPVHWEGNDPKEIPCQACK